MKVNYNSIKEYYKKIIILIIIFKAFKMLLQIYKKLIKLKF